MKVAGILAEYNPFHKGHAYHIEKTRRATGCDWVIAVMAGSFTQRGEPAIASKWARAEMALRSGVDLVLELPALFAVRTADWFAHGGVSLLGALQVVDTLSFGCEIGETSRLNRAADALSQEPEEFRALLREGLAQGQSHARARGAALNRLLGEDFSGPNTALALEYIAANRSIARPMELLPIARRGDYHDRALPESAFASASAIRHAILSGDTARALSAIPDGASSLLAEELPRRMADPARLDPLALYTLRSMTDDALAGLPDISEGLDRRVRKICRTAIDLEDFLLQMKCKRYTHARLSRLCAHALLQMNQSLADWHPDPTYARVIGFRSGCAPLLRRIKEQSLLPLITDPVRLKGDECFELETRATDLWGQLTASGRFRRAGSDYTHPIVRVD